MISIIVPVYNVEQYLRQCLDSIINQTYGNIEIIVIDDGSTDGCPQICDEYRERDGRVAVFHTENRGLSAARNLGIGKANGEWIMFVDSDDWVDTTFCELPYRTARENRADLVIFNWTVVDGENRIANAKQVEAGVVSAEMAIEKGSSFAWDKLYYYKLFEGIRYPEGQLFEDIATTHQLVYRAERIVLLKDALYSYRKRKGSISEIKTESAIKAHFCACLKKYDDLLAFGYPKEKLDMYIISYCLNYLSRLEPSEELIYLRAEEIVTKWKGNPAELKPYERNALKVWKLNNDLFHSICRQKGLKLDGIE